MTLIKVKRPPYFTFGRGKLKVWINEQHVGAIPIGRERVFEVTEGIIHTVQVSQGWCKSLPLLVDCASEEEVVVLAEPIPNFLIALVYSCFQPWEVFRCYIQTDFRYSDQLLEDHGYNADQVKILRNRGVV